MSTLEEVQSLVAADREKAAEAISSIEGTKAAVEETVSVYESVGAEGSAAQAASLIDQLEEAQATVQSAMSALEAVDAQAEALKTGKQSSGVSLDVTDAVTPADATAIPSEQWRNDVGEPLKAPADIDDENDQTGSKFRRGGRSLVRSTGRIKDQSEDLATSTNFMSREPAPPPGGAYTGQTIHEGPTMVPLATPSPGPTDIVGTVVVVTAALIEGVSRLRKNRNDTKL